MVRSETNIKSAALRRKRRKRRQRITWLVGVIVVVIVMLGFACRMLRSNQGLQELQGVWVYDEYTKYEFDGNGNGCMCLENWHYEYTYSVSGDRLSLDFEDEAVHDCAYLYLIEEDTLNLEGKEGTTGGKYVLKLQK